LITPALGPIRAQLSIALVSKIGLSGSAASNVD
jgi:hypothetical protein